VKEEKMRIPVAAAAVGITAAAAAFRRMRPDDDLAGEVAVVTGASRGLGLLLGTDAVIDAVGMEAHGHDRPAVPG
jgi:hypothetical protein